MTKRDKLEQRLYSKPKDFHWDELRSVLVSKGYEDLQGRGSRVKFRHKTCEDALIIIHKPHPSGILKAYQIKEVIEALEILENE
jgi:predicted RNA binding protein YcfA (HicA-like mRNA interferase family)